MEHLLVSIPPDQFDFITQLLNKLSVQVTKVDSSDVNLTSVQYARLQESIEQAKSGKTMSTETMKSKANKWLTE